jgi:hypothetical protein
MMPQARAGINEQIIFPYALPTLPQRVYFLFQEPIDTKDLNVYDKKECRLVYESIKGHVTDGIQTLIRFRKEDPYMRFFPRVIYERNSGGNRAPTALLNTKC